MYVQYQLSIRTHGRGLKDITADVIKCVNNANVQIGLCNVFLHHTSASLILCENTDSKVQNDLELFMKRLVPDGDSIYTHTAEGADDMPSHVRTILTASSLNIPVSNKKLTLGTWQGIYLWEHRFKSHQRKLTITVHGN